MKTFGILQYFRPYQNTLLCGSIGQVQRTCDRFCKNLSMLFYYSTIMVKSSMKLRTNIKNFFLYVVVFFLFNSYNNVKLTMRDCVVSKA